MKRSFVSLQKSKDEADTHIQVNDRESNMFFFFRDACFIFAVIFTAYASLLNSQSKTKKAASPVPFFWSGSVVEDYYKGDLQLLMKKISKSHHAFVMFYAPWDADSIEARNAFEEVAQFFEDEVYFGSVNCWHPGSQCRTTFKNIPRYPQLIAYLGPQKAIEYRGPIDVQHMIKFVHSLLNPLTRVNAKSEIWDLRFQHDALLLGCLKMNGLKGSKGYNLLYTTAWKMTGKDYGRRLGFAVLTHDKINHSLNVTDTPTYILYLWNREIIYDGELKVEALIDWLAKETSKSELVKDHIPSVDLIMPNPVVLVVFYRPQPLLRYDYLHLMLRKVAMKFYGCPRFFNKTSDADYFLHLFEWLDVYALYEEKIIIALRKEKENCMKIRRQRKVRTCPTVSVWTNSTCAQQSCPLVKNKEPESKKRTYSEWNLQLNCEILERSTDDLVAIISTGWSKSHVNSSTGPYEINACNSHTSVFFSLLDIDKHQHLVSSLNIDTTVPQAIFINAHEMMRVNGPLNEPRLGKMLGEFVNGRISTRRRHHRKGSGLLPRTIPLPLQSAVSLIEANSETYHKIVFNESKTVVVLYYSRECGSCAMVSMALLRVAQSLKPLLNDHITFMRINGDTNDLPFHLQVAVYPTVIIFPAYRKAESRVFPSKKPSTVENLTRFILASLEPKLRVITMAAACSKWSNIPSKSVEGEACIKEVRLETVELIAEALRCWRARLSGHRRALDRLAFLRRAYLRLASVPHISSTVNYLLRIY